MDQLSPVHPRNPVSKILDKTANSEDVSNNKHIEGSENIYLPSKGIFYRGNFHNLEYLKVRPLDWTDEDILTTQSYYDNGTLLNEILNNCIVDTNGFKASDLVAVDRDTILLWLRSSAFGKIFEIEFPCPNTKCKSHENGNVGTISWDLSELDIPSYSEEVFEILSREGALIIETPSTDTKVKITVPPIGLVNRIEKNYQLKKEREKTSKDYIATSTLLSVVEGVEVEPGKFVYEKDEIVKHFKKIRLPLGDSRYILHKAKKLNLKYETGKIF